MNPPDHPIAAHAQVRLQPPDPGYVCLVVETQGGNKYTFMLTKVALRELQITLPRPEEGKPEGT